RERRAPHHLVDREIPERPFAQEGLGRREDLALRQLRRAAATSGGLLECLFRGQEWTSFERDYIGYYPPIDSVSITLYVRCPRRHSRHPQPEEETVEHDDPPPQHHQDARAHLAAGLGA